MDLWTMWTQNNEVYRTMREAKGQFSRALTEPVSCYSGLDIGCEDETAVRSVREVLESDTRLAAVAFESVQGSWCWLWGPLRQGLAAGATEPSPPPEVPAVSDTRRHKGCIFPGPRPARARWSPWRRR